MKFKSTSREIALRWIPQKTFDDEVSQVMVRCHQTRSHYLPPEAISTQICYAICHYLAKISEIKSLFWVHFFLSHRRRINWIIDRKMEERFVMIYCQISNISHTTNPKIYLVWSCSCLCPIHWSEVLSREWRCSWSNADRRCSNYIWVINDCIAY